ncbi:reductive dehalogenase [Dehalobacter sp. MCB1]|uniref:reductive dehalogenase n=1 Tax=unclassified Dehalobacter TaxID=2635733 RepID=UPI000E6B9604|nr:MULTISPECIES: reductive dehalogenase [unclassified Dehalobacter]RJE48954.1 reductive dehalogenase [Dehalobacter sp. MCB1]TCX50953.1 reductive dehalogenase [Dehalobacter sp. 12DCB1]
MSRFSDHEGRQQQPKLQMNRRNFLKAGAASAIGMGILGAVNALPAKAADAVTNASVPQNGAKSKLHPVMDYGGASVRFVEHNDQWLGTSKLVGTVKNTHEAEMGFALACRGKLTPESQRGYYHFQFVMKHPLNAAIGGFAMNLAPEEMVDGKPSPTKLPIPDPEQMSQHIKDCAYFLRADEVGIGKMPAFAYYEFKSPPIADLMKDDLSKSEPVTESLPYVIVIMVDQNLKTLMASTGYDGISGSQSFLGYHGSAVISVILANYIRNLGYNARAHHFSNYALILAPCMVSAGLGEMTRTGDCIAHPTIGFRNKAAAVTTDLPLLPDRPIDFGAQDFCRVCKKCADNCPSGAITQDEDYIEKNGILRWQSDIKKCVEFRVTNKEGSMCGRCMKVCPWNSKEDSWFHQAGTFIGSHGETASSLLKQIDDIFGYGTEQIEKYKWWLEWPERY